MRCHGGRALFSLPNEALCSAIWRRTGSIIWHSKPLHLWCPSSGSLCRPHVNPRNRSHLLLRPMGQCLPFTEHFRPSESTVSTFPWSPVCISGSMFRRSGNNAKIPYVWHLNSVKYCSEVVWRLRLSKFSKRGTRRADSFLMANTSDRI